MKNLVMFLLSIFSMHVVGQINNPGFENWTSNVPDGWTTGNTYLGQPPSPLIFESPSTLRVEGKYAMKCGFQPFPVPGSTITATSYFHGYAYQYNVPIAYRPICLQGSYILNNSLGSDTFWVSVRMKKNNVVIGKSLFLDPTPTSTTSFSSFCAQINYSSTSIPDAFDIDISLNSVQYTYQYFRSLSYFIVDDLQFLSLNGLPESDAAQQFLLYPLPAKDFVQIKSSLDIQRPIKIQIFNAQSLLLREINVQENDLLISLSDFADGLYLVRITSSDTRIANLKLIVSR